MKNSGPTKNKLVTIILFLSLAASAVVIFYFYYTSIVPYIKSSFFEQEQQEQQQEQEGDAITYLYNELLYGDQESALIKMEELMENETFAANEAIGLKLIYSGILYKSFLDEDKRRAIDLVVGIIEEPTISGVDRANAIRTLISFAYMDIPSFNDSEELFPYRVDYSELNDFSINYEGLSKSENSRDRQESIKILAEYAHSIEPFSYTAMVQASWFANQLAEIEDTDISQDYATSVNSYLAEADKLLKNEKTIGYMSPIIYWNDVSFYYWKAEALAILEIFNLPTEQSFEDAFLKAIEIQDSLNKSGEGDVVDLSLTVHFLYAWYLNEIYGEERIEDIKALLDAFVGIVEYETGAIYYFVQYTEPFKPYYDFEGSSVHELTMINDGFSTIMSELGWRFEAR